MRILQNFGSFALVVLLNPIPKAGNLPVDFFHLHDHSEQIC
jgi:hypothetical protein